MSRPKPTILLTHTYPKSYKVEQVLLATSLYAVFHGENPVNVRLLDHLIIEKGAKYRKTSFCHPGHAFNLADRLNQLFKTDEFHVRILNQGTRIVEGQIDPVDGK